VRQDLDEIDARLEEMQGIADWTDELEDEHGKLEERHDELSETCVKAFTPEQKARAGAVLMEDYAITCGFIWPVAEKTEVADEGETLPDVKPWSQALVDDVDSYGTVAAQLAIMREPVVADAMMLAGMYQDTQHHTNVRVMALHSADRFCNAEINADIEIDRALKSFDIKGAEFWSVFEQIRAMPLPDRELLRAALVARALKKRRGPELEALLGKLSTCDLAATWMPGREFFERLNVTQLSGVHEELTGYRLADPTTKKSAVQTVLEKAEAAGWVPKWLRAGLKVAPAKKRKKAA
jgi:hypothetical protein